MCDIAHCLFSTIPCPSQATLSNLAPGYYCVVVTVVMGDGGEYPFDFPTTAGLGIAVGAPGAKRATPTMGGWACTLRAVICGRRQFAF